MIKCENKKIEYKGDNEELVIESYTILAAIFHKVKDDFGDKITSEILHNLLELLYEDIFEVSLEDYWVLKNLPPDDILQ